MKNLSTFIAFFTLSVSLFTSCRTSQRSTLQDTSNSDGENYMFTPTETPEETRKAILEMMPRLSDSAYQQQNNENNPSSSFKIFDPVTIATILGKIINTGKLCQQLWQLYKDTSPQINVSTDWANGVPKNVKEDTLGNFSEVQMKTFKFSMPPKDPVYQGEVSVIFRYNGGVYDTEAKKYIGHYLTHVTFHTNGITSKALLTKMELKIARFDLTDVSKIVTDHVAGMTLAIEGKYSPVFGSDQTYTEIIDLSGDSDKIRLVHGDKVIIR